MGSYCEIYFDGIEVCSAKSVVPEDFCAIFQESDRHVLEPDDENGHLLSVVYKANRDVVLDRLALLGCTASVAREQLTEWFENERKTWEEYASEPGGAWAAKTAQALREFSPEQWYARVPEALATRDTQDQLENDIDRRLRAYDADWLWFDGYGSLIVLRALLDACRDTRVVTLDVSDLVGGGWLEIDSKICDARRQEEVFEVRPLAPTVILAEGRSDTKILKHSLSALFPERQDYFSFFEHAELTVDGGTTYLVKFLKAFAAARVPVRMVAVFDNDTAGIRAYRQAQGLQLPENLIVFRLPDIELAGSYPTIGPQGRHVVDVNGRGAAIELYLGRSALTLDGSLSLIRWTGYDKTADAYQGEVEAKVEVQKEFFRALKKTSTPAEARARFPELARVWQAIFDVVERSAEAVQRKSFDGNWNWR